MATHLWRHWPIRVREFLANRGGRMRSPRGRPLLRLEELESRLNPSSPSVSGNLVANGGFETGDLTDWTFTPASSNSDFSVGRSPIAPHSGNYAAQFGATAEIPDAITQTLATQPGSTYTLSYWVSHDERDSANDFQVSWGGNVVQHLSNTSAFDWTNYTFSETATSTTTVLRFAAYEVPAWYALDDVSVSGAQSMNAAPVVTTQPVSLTVNVGDTASFTAAASGTPTPSVQWEAEAPGADGFTPLSDGGVYSGTATGTLSISHVAGLNGYHFEAVFTNGVAPDAPSNSATLTVASRLALTGSQTLAAGTVSGPFTVQLEDPSGNAIGTDGDANDVITLSDSGAGGRFYSDAQGTNLVASVPLGDDGSATFYYVNTRAGSPTLTAADATHEALTAGTQSETVNAGPATQLVFITQPHDTTAGQPVVAGSGQTDSIEPTGQQVTPTYVQVEVEDQFGNLVSSGGPSSILIGAIAAPQRFNVTSSSVSSLAAAAPFDPNSTTSEPVNNGIATFSNLIVQTAGRYQLTASGDDLTNVPSDPFTVTHGAASSITFSPASTTFTAGQPSDSITLTVLDGEGNLVPGEEINLTTTNPDTGQFDHNTVTTGSDGTVTFTYKDMLAGSVTLTATDANPALASVTATQSDMVIAAGPFQMTFTQQPANATAGQPFGTDVKVKVVDQFGNPVIGDVVTLAVASGPSGESFDPASTITASTDGNGVADFGNLILDAAGGYKLKATDSQSIADDAPISATSGVLAVFPAFVTISADAANISAGSAVPTVMVGDAFTVNGTFSDQGTAPVNVLINWGDGTAGNPDVTAGVLSGGSGSFTFTGVQHYGNEGAFPVSVTVVDAGGNEVGVGALSQEVQVLLAKTSSVDSVQGQTGQTVSQTVTDAVTGTVITASLTLSNGDAGGGTVIAAALTNFVPPPTSSVLQTVASFDVRENNVPGDASALVTFIIPGVLPSGTTPQLLYLDTKTDPAHPTLKPFQPLSQATIIQEPNEIIVSMLLNSTSTPTLQQATGTVFTVAASTANAAVATAVSAATASNAPGANFAVQTASFQSTSQLTLPLAAAQASQLSTTRSALSTTDAGGGDEQPMTDAQADALIKFLFEKLDLVPKDLMQMRLEQIIRLWLNQVSLTPPDGSAAHAAAAQPDRAEGDLAAAEFLFRDLQSGFARLAAPDDSGAAAQVVVQPWAEGGKQAPDAPTSQTPAYTWAIPVVGLGLGAGAVRRKRRQQQSGRRT